MLLYLPSHPPSHPPPNHHQWSATVSLKTYPLLKKRKELYNYQFRAAGNELVPCDRAVTDGLSKYQNYNDDIGQSIQIWIPQRFGELSKKKIHVSGRRREKNWEAESRLDLALPASDWFSKRCEFSEPVSERSRASLMQTKFTLYTELKMLSLPLVRVVVVISWFRFYIRTERHSICAQKHSVNLCQPLSKQTCSYLMAAFLSTETLMK